MYRKLLLYGITFFYCNIISDTTPLPKLIIPTAAFDFTKAKHPNKKNKAPVTPFWETSKKNNVVDTAALKQSGWYAGIIKNIEAGEYEISKDEKPGTYVAANPQQQLKVSFNYNSFTLQPGNTEQDWTLKMQVCGIYACKKLITGSGENNLPVMCSNKIVFNNSIFNTEYINSKEGIRQNFIIQKEPASKPQTINIKLQTHKGWYINKVHDKELHFAKLEGDGLSKKITYSSLKVWDANNKELDARFIVNTKHTAFEIEVNTKDAVYPITIDPLSASPATILNGISAGDNFGYSVASAGDVNGDGYSDVIVGAPGVSSNTGKAYVFMGSATGLSGSPAVTLNGISTNDYFGYSVGNAGDVNKDGYNDVFVGAYGVSSSKGAVYIFYGSLSGLSATPLTTLNGVASGNLFGWSAACAGDVNNDGYSDVIVGAWNVGVFRGAAYLFLGSSTGLVTSPISTLSGIHGIEDRFGWSVASAGDVNGDGYSDVIIGAFGAPVGGTIKGEAYLFLGSGTGLPASPSTTLSGLNANDEFGYNVSSAGDVNGDGYSDVIIGAIGVSAGKGAAYLYLGAGSGLSSTISATLNGVSTGDQFGICVTCAGDINGDGFSDVIVGAYGVASGKGAAYLFLGSSTGLAASPATTLNGISTNDFFGYSVASAGDVNGDGYSDVIVGAYRVATNKGAAYLFLGSSSGLAASPATTLNGVGTGDAFGWSVASAGDVNGDGYSDVIVGAYGVASFKGAAYLFLGSSSGLAASPATTLNGVGTGDYFGYSVASAGDVNGDGYSDVIVGAYAVASAKGAAYLFLGSSTGLAASPATTLNGVGTGDLFGWSVASAGDVNGDGYSDVIVGAFAVASAKGAAYLFLGSSSGLAASPATTLNGVGIGNRFGWSIASAGDVNGDGYSDVIVGAYGVASFKGAAYLFLGSSTGLAASPATTLNGISTNDFFGYSVASAGDVNGDGYSDVIVGAYGVASSKGAAYLFLGSSTGLVASPATTLNGISTNDYFGISVASAGDVNGDGYSDVIVGAPAVASYKGAAYLFLGSSSGLAASPATTLNGVGTGDNFGYSVASAGDVNGDGYSDVIVGAYAVASGKGAAYLFSGNSPGGYRNNLRLYNTDLITPIQQSNVLVPNLFGAGLFSKSALGRVKGKLVWEVKQQGQPFSGNPITNSTAYLDKLTSFTDLGTAGTELKSNVQKVGRQNKIRARVEYDKATAITGQVYGPWRYPAAYLQGAHGMNSVPLPVKLNWFTGALVGVKVKLQWQSSDDENIAAYKIERSSDNRNFTAIGSVSSLHQNRNSYNFTDNQPLKGTSWYRLKITDEYNRINYSGTVVIKNTNDAVSIYPTVISKGGHVNLQFKNSVTGALEIRLVNMSGAIVFKKLMATNGNTLILELPSLPSGVYILSAMQNGEKLITQKIIIR